MKFFKRLRRNLRGSILTAFSVLLFASFALMGGIFNIAVNQYIRLSAVTELDQAQALFRDIGPMRIVRPGLFGQFINHFYMNNDYAVDFDYSNETTTTIATALWEKGHTPEHIANRRLRTDNGIFYVSSQPVLEGGQWFVIFYVDVTDISRFSTQVNMVLLLLMAVILSGSMVVTTYLAGSLALPLRRLRHFARRIGQGDFTPNAESFANEEFEALNQSLNHTARQLAKYDADQKIFFQNVSHDLRTPLMTIKSYAEGINRGIMDGKGASQTILDATDRLTGMVGDILYISRIDNITLPQVEEADLCALIEERIRQHRPLAGGTAIDFRRNEPVYIDCNTSYIERALDNLISNALRYAESAVIIECRGIESRAVIRVIDDGPGFEPDALPHVFERFYRGKNGIAGIGLSIVKSIVEQHKGTATAENQEKGAVLTISLPRKRKARPS